jgi:hypothetical protein
MEPCRALTGDSRDPAGRRAPIAGSGKTPTRIVALLALAGFAAAMSGCSTADGPYKPRDKDPNAGGNGSMYKAADKARSW